MNVIKSQSQRCYFCNNVESLFVESHTDSGQKYNLFHCQVCGAEWWDPMKNPGAEWYEQDERYANRNIDPILKPNEKHRDTIDFFGNKSGKVLDVGCGVGNFLTLAEQKGWECWGIDFDRDSIVTAQKTFGLKNLEAVDLSGFITKHPEQKFDLVTFFDVFEHIDNHKEFLSQVKSMLKTDGYIALSVPYRHGWRWLMPHDLPPRHLTKWDAESLGRYLAQNGFVVKKVWKLPASWNFLVMKFRWNYGRFARFGLVKAAKRKAYEDTKSREDAVLPARRPLIKILHTLAKTKDFILFGVPATFLWLVLLFTDKRHTDFYLVAQRTED